jgi:hypothetical protein
MCEALGLILSTAKKKNTVILGIEGKGDIREVLRSGIYGVGCLQ